jgi:DNA-binding IclR family transcriptional regulator
MAPWSPAFLRAPRGCASRDRAGDRDRRVARSVPREANEGSQRGSQAVHRVLRILLCWAEDDATLSLTEVAQRIGLTLPTAHRMIKTLQSEGFLVQDRISGRYALGPAIMDLARVMLQRSDQEELVLTVVPHLERMRAITGETVGLHLPMGDIRMCVAELVSRQPIRAATGVGRTFKLPEGAAGKILVAWSPERFEIVETENRASRQQRDAFAKELERVRRQGYAISEGETIPGAAALAFPVFGPDGDVRAAINIPGPANRWTHRRMTADLPKLSDEANQVSEQLGHRLAPHPLPARSGSARAGTRPAARRAQGTRAPARGASR